MQIGDLIREQKRYDLIYKKLPCANKAPTTTWKTRDILLDWYLVPLERSIKCREFVSILQRE